MNLSLSGFTKATLTGGTWTGLATLSGGTATSNGTDTLAVTRDASMTLTNASLKSNGFGALTLSSLEVAQLTGGAGGNTFTVGGWSGSGTLTGGGGSDTVTATRDADFSLSRTQLVIANGPALTLSGLSVANLTGGASNNVFTVSGWRGTGTITGAAGSSDQIVAVRDTDMTLTNTSLVAAGFGTLTLNGIKTANLSGGDTGDVLRASAFTLGKVTLVGGAGDDLLLGGSKDDSLVGGTGNDVLIGGEGNDSLEGGDDRDLLIGGAGADSLFGGDGDDILIGGTCSLSSNIVALAEIMAEWTSDNDYATRVENFLSGGGANDSTVLNSSTVQNDANASDSLAGGLDSDWFFQSANDVLDAINGDHQIITPI